MYLVTDLDRPDQGLLKTDQEPMTDVRAFLRGGR
jgi:hypothetical protein